MKFFDSATQERPSIKVCGFTDGQNAMDAAKLGIDAIGINFWPKSKRFIAPETAAEWLGGMAGQVCRIGLFVNPTIEEIEDAVDHCVLDTIQLHGDETPQFCDEIAGFGLPVIKAIGVLGDAPVSEPASFPTRNILLDAYAPEEFGGTGRSFRWDVVQEVMTKHPDVFLILAGGLTPENIAEAAETAKPHAVDLASGVESAPGIKDLEKIRQLVSALRSTEV